MKGYGSDEVTICFQSQGALRINELASQLDASAVIGGIQARQGSYHKSVGSR